MACTLIGCLINLVLDPLFIFVFHMGMAGAAWATIIGQIISASMVIWYLTRFKTVKLTLKELRPRAFACRRILSLGTVSYTHLDLLQTAPGTEYGSDLFRLPL